MAQVLGEDAPVRLVLVTLLLAISGFVASQLMSIPAVLVDPTITTSPTDASPVALATLVALSYLGFALVGAAYLRWTGYGWSFLDLRIPTRAGWLYALAGIVGSIVLVILFNALVTALELPSAEAQAGEIVGTDPTLILLMIVLVFLFNAPAEEFLFRNVIQKRLYDAFSKTQAVVVASAIFALAHIPSYGFTLEGEFVEPIALVAPLGMLFVGSLVFGYVYAKTDNLVVPIVAHAGLNGIQFGLLYLLVRYRPELLEEEMGAGTGTSAIVDLTLAVL